MVTLDPCRIALFTAILSLVASSLHAAEAPASVRRVRMLEPCLPSLLADAAALSPTVRALLDRIDRSDLIVFVRCAAFLHRSTAGRLLFLGAAAAHRYLLIEIRIPAVWHMQAAAVAHELQHAVEVAEAGAIRSQAGMAQHYLRTGIQVGGQSSVFETDAARRTGLRVRRELPVVPDAESARMRESRGDLMPQR